MKKILLVSVILAASLLSGCDEGESDPITMTIKDDKQFLIPSSTRSCTARKKGVLTDDLASKYVSFQNVTLTWGDAATNVYISMIQISVKSSDITGGGFEQIIGGTELLALVDVWNDTFKVAVLGTRAVPGTAVLPTASLRIDCPLTAGRISTVAKPFSAFGTITVIGVKEAADGTRTPVSTTAPITIENKF